MRRGRDSPVRTRRPKSSGRADASDVCGASDANFGHARTRAPQSHSGQGQTGRVVLSVGARVSVRVSMRCAKHESDKYSGRGDVRVATSGKPGAARKTAGRQGGCTATGKFFSLSEYGDFRPLAYASRGPGPSLVRVVDIRGPRSRPPRDDHQVDQPLVKNAIAATRTQLLAPITRRVRIPRLPGRRRRPFFLAPLGGRHRRQGGRRRDLRPGTRHLRNREGRRPPSNRRVR